MNTTLSSRRGYYITGVSLSLLMVALIGGMVGCIAIEYNLAITSTAGGSVTTPGEGSFAYDTGMMVNFVATPASGYQFANWTGNVGTVANVNAASTTITMSGNYSITANFRTGGGVVFPAPQA